MKQGIRSAIMLALATVIISALYTGFHSPLRAQDGNGIELKGRVYNSTSKKPVSFATVVILEARVKARTDTEGNYRIAVPETGEYTVIVRSDGLKMLKLRMKIKGIMTRDFWLMALRIRGSGITIMGERKIQKLSRRTMTVEDLKETPASFGDSLSALSSLPGVERVGGFFGPLVIRGMYSSANRYYIDDMPLNYPIHFGGLHSVINNSLMSEIDLYSSSFPNEFGGPMAAVIDINTVDSVREFGGYTDVGAISATALIKTPVTRKVIKDGEVKEENAGYVMASGRIGYMSLLVPLFYRIATGDEIESVPEYWDYQVKAKYFFNSRHSLTMLILGAKDYITFVMPKGAIDPEDGDDPLLQDLSFDYDQMFHNQGIYYTYQLDRFKNTLMAYSALSSHYTYLTLGGDDAPDWAKDYNITSNPSIFGLREKINLEWWKKHAELRGAAEYTLYYFNVHGKTIAMNQSGFIDLTDPDAILIGTIDRNIINHTLGGYLDNRFVFGGLEFVPGVRYQYLERSGDSAVDARAMISYEFKSETTVSAAGGTYSSFIQTNPGTFVQLPDLAAMDYAKPERALHRAVGIEQVLGLYTLSLEGFYNSYYDQTVMYPHYTADGDYRIGKNSGKLRAWGFEVLLRKDRREGTNGLFGWLSYTWTRSKFRSGITGYVYDHDTKLPTAEIFDPNGDRWLTSDVEMEHAGKLVMGYRHNRHTLSCRFQVYTSFPYTAIVGDDDDPLGIGRYGPVFSNDINAEHSDIDHRLDIRYSFKTRYEWGYVSWYVEVINVYGLWYKPRDDIDWKYNEPYQEGQNPELNESSGLSLIPNFGVEVKF